MRYLPHTEEEIRAMLERIGVNDVDALFLPIPEAYDDEARERRDRTREKMREKLRDGSIEGQTVDISVEEGMLTISGEKNEEKTEGSDDKKYHLVERTYGMYQRSFSLPRGVDATKITADFKNGVLKVHMPKTTEAQAKGRKIDIAVT